VLAFRPKTKHRTYKDCYFVGASTHPGTGVPICLAGAKITAGQILSDRGQAAPWPAWTPTSAKGLASASALDVQRYEPPVWAKPLLALLLGVFVLLTATGRGPAALMGIKA
jgi:phytoene desaturase (3,4-didehydrolycopene-forming)